MTTLDIQLIPGPDDWGRLREASLVVDGSDYGTLWVCDHLAGYSMSSTSMLEAWSWLGALAEATSRAELGVLVMNVSNRNPAVGLVAAASIARISGRRFHLGLGAGTSPRSSFAREQVATSTPIASPMAARHARLEEVLDLIDRMWDPDRGEEFDSFPTDAERPHVIVGVNSLELAAIAGRRADGVNVRWSSPHALDQLRAARDAAGGRPFELTAYTLHEDGISDPGHPVRRAVEEAGVDRLVVTHIGVPDAAEIERYRA